MLSFPAVLPSTQSHTCLCSFSTYRHTVTPAYAFLLIHIHKTYTDTHLYPHCHCWWLQLVGSALVLFFWSGQGLSDLCVCVQQCVYLCTCTVFLCLCWCVGDTCRDRVIFSMHMCGQVWFLCMWTVRGASVAPYSFNTRFWRSVLSPLQISLLQSPSVYQAC